MKNPILKTALGYAQCGWSVIPLYECNGAGCTCLKGAHCESKGKHPRIAWTQYQAKKATEKEIREWLTQWPDSNIGIVTGSISGIIVLDVDGKKGVDTLTEQKLPVPATATSRTGGGGWHYLYQHPGGDCRNFAGKAGKTILPSVDFRGDGGLIVAPPSIHGSGNRYEWAITPEAGGLAEAPSWLIELIRAQANGEGKRVTPEDWGRTVKEGERNDTLTRLAGSLLAKMKPADALPMLAAWNREHCKPPIGVDEIQAMIVSIGNNESREAITTVHLTDMGNAERMAKLHDGNAKYCTAWGKWLLWDGARWKCDQTDEATWKAKEAVRAIYAEAATIDDRKVRKDIAQHAIRTESAMRIKAMLALAESEPGIPIRPDDLDRDKWLLACKNTTIHLRDSTPREPRRSDLITKLADVTFDPGAGCPNWISFLSMIMADNVDIIRFLQKAIGYSLTGITDERCLFILHGKGRNGKTTLVQAIATMLGDYARRAPTETLLLKKHDSIPNDVAMLKGARFVYCSESREGRSLSEALIKDLTGTDQVTARFLRQEWFEFQPEFKIWLSTNHKPVIKGTDDAIWDRIRLVPFEVRIPDEKIKPASEVYKIFADERPGILNWALEGLRMWQKEELQMPEKIKTATNNYRTEMDTIQEFINDRCILGKTEEVSVKQLYEDYTAWCAETDERPLGKRVFGSRMAEKGFDQYQKTSEGNARTWIGLTIN